VNEVDTLLQLVKVLAEHGIATNARALADVCGDLDIDDIVQGLRRSGRTTWNSCLPRRSYGWTERPPS
jgi:hypothetical protein